MTEVLLSVLRCLTSRGALTCGSNSRETSHPHDSTPAGAATSLSLSATHLPPRTHREKWILYIPKSSSFQHLPGNIGRHGRRATEILSDGKGLQPIHIGHRAKKGLSSLSVFDPQSHCPSSSVSETWTPFNPVALNLIVYWIHSHKVWLSSSGVQPSYWE